MLLHEELLRAEGKHCPRVGGAVLDRLGQSRALHTSEVVADELVPARVERDRRRHGASRGRDGRTNAGYRSPMRCGISPIMGLSRAMQASSPLGVRIPAGRRPRRQGPPTAPARRRVLQRDAPLSHSPHRPPPRSTQADPATAKTLSLNGTLWHGSDM